MSSVSLHSMNNDIKGYLNEASGISLKCRRKFLKLVEENFYVDLPDEDYLNVDIKILANSNVVMRDIEYPTAKEVQNFDEVVERYQKFQKEVLELLGKNETNFEVQKKKNEILNLIIVFGVCLLGLLIVIFLIREFLMGNFFGVLYILVLATAYRVIPSLDSRFRNRFLQAKKFLNRLFRK